MDGIIYTAVVYEDKPHTVGIFETKLEIINGVSSAPVTTSHDSPSFLARGATDSVPAARVLDLQFLDDRYLLLLCQAADGTAPPYLVRTPFQRSAAGVGGGGIARELAFPEDLTAFAPVQMEVLGANDARGEVPDRVSLLGRDRASCKVFALRGMERCG